MQPLSRALRHSASSRLSVASALPQLLGSRAPARAMGGGGGHDHTLEPPLQRLPLPNRPLPEEDELIWNDRVAPETALDLDAPHVSPLEGLLMWLGGFAFFFGVYQYAVSTSHPANKPTNKRELPEEDIARALGGYAKGGYAHQ